MEAAIKRKTNETDIELYLNTAPEKRGFTGTTGIGFFDHMMNSFCIHGGFAAGLNMTGDLGVDCHHTVEDVGITLGQAFKSVIEQNKNIARFAHEYVPMDESLAFAAVDISGRAYLVFDAEFKSDRTGGMDTQTVVEFFRAFSAHAGITLHLKSVYGENDHHKIEALFKAAARVLKTALKIEGDEILSAKGVI